MEELLNKIEMEKAKHLALLKRDGGLTRQNIDDYNALCKLKKNLMHHNESKANIANPMQEHNPAYKGV